jgi:bacteriocin biosynthesis cyclodehydratase domain-containing protein
MTLRIDPALALVWRDPSTMQLGLDPPRAVVPVPTTAQERLLCALRDPVDRRDLARLAGRLGCPPTDAAAVIGNASPAMCEPPLTPDARVEVLGDTDLAEAIAAMLHSEGVAVVRSRPPVAGRVVLPVPAPTLAVSVADHVTDPALRAAWTVRGVPHVPVVVGDGRVRIGPVLRSADDPCLQCLELHRVTDDPAWPVLAAQVWGRPAPSLGAYRAASVAVHVVAAVLSVVRATAGADPVRMPSPIDGAQLLVDRQELGVTSRTVSPHPACACRTPPGNDSANVPRPGWNRDATRSP